MTETDALKHPIRDAEIHVFKRIFGAAETSGLNYIARLYPYDSWPIFFHGETYGEAHQKASDFIDETTAKHEATYAVKQEALARARAKRKEKAK